MTKTFEIQVELARNIVAESKKRLSEMQNKGCEIDAAKLEALIDNAKVIEERDNKKTEMKVALSQYTKQLNDDFIGFKTEILELKKFIKGNYPPSQWVHFGIMDKK